MKRKRHLLQDSLSRLVAKLLTLTLTALVTHTAAAATWDGGGGNGLWSDPMNWVGDVLPGPTAEVRIENTADEVHVDVDLTAGQLFLDGDPGMSPTLVVDAGVTLTLSDGNHVSRGHSVIRNQGTVLQGGRVLVFESAAAINDGTWTVTDSKLEPNSSVPFVNNGTLAISGDATLEVWRSIVNHGTVELIGGTDADPEMAFVNNGEFHNAFDGLVIGTGPEEPELHLGRSSIFGNASPGTFRNDGTVTLDGVFQIFDGSTLINAATFDNSGGHTITLGRMILDDTGTLLLGALDERRKYWTGGGDGTRWSDPANWSPFPFVPSSSSQRVNIEATPDGAAITVDVDAQVRSLFVDPDPGTLDLTIDPGVSFAIGTFNIFSFLRDGTNLINNGTLSIDRGISMSAGASLNNHATLNVNDVLGSSGVITNAGNLTVTAAGEIVNDGSIINTGTATNENKITNGFGALFDNFGTLDNAAGIFNNDGTFVSECDSLLVGTISGNPPVVIPCDTTPPVITVPNETTTEATSLSGAVVFYVVSASDEADGSVAPTCTPVSGATFAFGTTSVTCTATDAAGNSASASFDVNVVDTTLPVLTPPPDVTAEAIAPLSTVAIGIATATDIFPVTITNNAPADYPLGDTLVTWTATDDNGNVSTANQTVTLVDTTPPMLTVPADLTVEANGVFSTVELGDAVATDIFGTVVSNDAPVAGFPLGLTVVTWTAIDAAGNTTMDTQNVTVVDTTPPELLVPPDVTVEATGPQGDADIGTASATDIFDVTITNDAPANYPLGTTEVTWTATDANGNSTSAIQRVTVVDTTSPDVTAALERVGGGDDGDDDDEGRFRVVYSATDLVDSGPAITAELVVGSQIIPIFEGQIIEYERDDEGAEIEYEGSMIEIEAPSLILRVTATDFSGNTAIAEAEPVGLAPDNDTEDEIDD